MNDSGGNRDPGHLSYGDSARQGLGGAHGLEPAPPGFQGWWPSASHVLPGPSAPFRPQTTRACGHTAVRGRHCVGHRADPWDPASSAPEQSGKTCPLQAISRRVSEFGEWTVCSTDSVSQRGALWAPDGGSLRSRCREPPLWSVPQPPGAPTTMLGDGERKVRSLPVLSPASTWAVGFRPALILALVPLMSVRSSLF